jgi:hypothetical protein
VTDKAYAYPPPMPRRPTNSMAIAALILGVVSLFSCQLLGIGAIFCGNRARAEIRAGGEDGDGMALAGIILGWVALALVALTVLGLIVYLAFVGFFLAGSGAGR